MGTAVEHGRGPQVRTGPIVAGAVLLAVGCALLLDTTGVWNINAGRLIGPFVLIGIGSAMLLGARSRGGGGAVSEEVQHGRQRGPFGGVWLIGLGCWLLISQTHMFGLTFGTSWPLLLILMGALIAVRGWR